GASSSADRTRLVDASQLLHRYTVPLVDAFPKMLREEIANAATGSRAKAFSFDSLELMAEDQVDDTVELVRGQQAVISVVEPDLVQINALVSALQGHDQVQAGTNPLRPEVWVKSLHRALGSATGVSVPVRALWMQHLCPAFGPQLAALYRKLAQDLMMQGVAAAAFAVSAPKHEKRRDAEAAQFNLRDLKRLLVSASQEEGDTQGMTRPGGETLNGMTVPAAMEALQGMNRMDDVVRRMQERWRSGVWHGERATQPADLGSMEYSPAQTLAREVVHQMVENIASDERLLPDVQHLLRRLEPALMHLVQRDQRFFSDRTHPARQLLEEITQRSLAWSKQNMGGFDEFMAPLQDTVQLLSGMGDLDAEPFDFALQALRQSWSDAEERARQKRAAVARALIKADARNHAVASIVPALRERPDIAAAPLEVRRFVLGQWAHVMAAAKLASPNEQDPGSYEALINDIVWSSQPRLAAQNLGRLKAISAVVLEQVRAGLASIGASAADSEPFIASLADAHARALRGDVREDAAPQRAPSDRIDWQEDAVPWLSPEEVQDSQIMQSTDFAPTDRLQRATGSGRPVPEVAVGQYIEVMARGSWSRWKLVWAAPHGTMLMFSDAGGRPESVTRATLRQMFESGTARTLAGRSVVDRALDGVAQTALDNSTRPAPLELRQSPM
ncbi:MAG TPA: DUF1631 family protein, partial [Ramlibacter sp.]